MTAGADPGTGYHRLATFGNGGLATFWELNLPAGTYFWSVQSIGANLASSPFAPERAFTIISPLITEATLVSSNSVRLRFTGGPGLEYSVFGSHDLKTWLRLGSAIETSSGRFEFTDETETNTSKFYQVRSP